MTLAEVFSCKLCESFKNTSDGCFRVLKPRIFRSFSYLKKTYCNYFLVILILLPKTGLNRISLDSDPVIVQPGWYFAVKKSSTSALLEVTTFGKEHPCSTRTTNFMIGEILGNHEHCRDSYYPHVDWHISFRFMHTVEVGDNAPVGPVKIIVTLKNQSHSIQAGRKDILIQVIESVF